MKNKKPTVSLVLGSGGARGLAHIGVIQVLEEKGFDIRSISGSSMGALIGGIYAAGKLDVYTKWVRALERRDVFRLLDFSFSGAAIFKGERIINTLKELIGECLIEDLPISFTAVATSLDEGREVWLSRGPLFDAIRASMAFPTIFTSFKINGKTLVDGGILNPIPIAPTLRDLTDLTVVVNLSGKAQDLGEASAPPPEELPNRSKHHQVVVEFIERLQHKDKGEVADETGFFDVISKSFDTMQNAISRLKLAAYSPDLIIEIPKNACSIYEFERAKELIAIGRRQAAAALEEEPRYFVSEEAGKDLKLGDMPPNITFE